MSASQAEYAGPIPVICSNDNACRLFRVSALSFFISWEISQNRSRRFTMLGDAKSYDRRAYSSGDTPFWHIPIYQESRHASAYSRLFFRIKTLPQDIPCILYIIPPKIATETGKNSDSFPMRIWGLTKKRKVGYND